MPMMANGVLDITNPNQSFTSNEWNQLCQSGLLSWIIERQATNDCAKCGGDGRIRHKGSHGGNGGIRTPGNASNDRVMAAVEQ